MIAINWEWNNKNPADRKPGGEAPEAGRNTSI
jgi:hypothetical protein